MKRPIIMLSALCTALTSLAQTDVTATYVQNASFENDNPATLTAVNQAADGLRGYTLSQPSAWTVSGANVTKLLVTPDCYTDNNFGKVTNVSDGQQAYYLRMGWSTGATTLQQTLRALPKGRYQLSADIRSAYANSATSSFQLFAGQQHSGTGFVQGTTGCFTTMPWTKVTTTFEVTEAQADVNVGLSVDWLSGGSCIMIDHVQLLSLGDDYNEPEEPTEQDIESLTEGVINSTFVGEAEMKADLLQMIANFARYLVNDYQDAQAPNSVGELCGCFRSNSTMQNNEDGVRSNADLSMITAFLVKYGKGRVTLPEGITWEQLENMAMRTLTFAYSTHKANKLKVCAGNNYWGSTSTSDTQWESSLWAMSVAYSAFFQWDKMSEAQKEYIHKLLRAECNYELYRSVPTGYAGDTKAEENGWEADVLAAALGLFPDDPLAPQWFAKLREFAINSYSHAADATDNTVIDPDYDNKTVANLYKGQNLYDDYTLQNHNYFHTSYQNVVIQELGEAALALKLFQQGNEKWKTNALMHNNLKVQQEVLNWLALADGELAMPNGNDWSLFLYDQITSYTTNATFLRDADALMLENLAYKYIKARQQSTSDGSWLLRSDIGARRMGVEGHRVMMTYLMHDVLSTADLQASDFEEFRARHEEARIIKSQNIVRAYNKDRFTTFSWAPGITSYTGYIAANSADKNKIVVPFKANNTGNFLGWYTVSGKGTNASPLVSGIYQLRGNSWVMNGELSTNDATLDNRFALFSTPGNAVIYLDQVTANTAATITGERGGLMAISTDELTRPTRTFYYGDTHKQCDGTTFTTFETPWINVDNALGIVAPGSKKMGFGDRTNNNSIMTARLYAAYSTDSRQVKSGDVVDTRTMVYYSNASAATTKDMSDRLIALGDKVPAGWNGVLAADPDSTYYLLLANFNSSEKAKIQNLTTPLGAPVFETETTISSTNDGKTSVSSATFVAEQNHSIGSTVKFFILGGGVTAKQDEKDSTSIYLLNNVKGKNTITVRAVENGNIVEKDVKLSTKTVKATLVSGTIMLDETAVFPFSEPEQLTAGYTDVSDRLANPSFEDDETYADATGNAVASGVTYNPCYVNKVAANDSRWANILPVKGWTPANTMTGGSHFCRMYSMPYSATLFCVSPNGVGNYAARATGMVADDSCGVRTLTMLNSWDKGANAIKQVVNLEAGTYRLLLNARYDCPNETANNGRVVTTSGNNTCTSLTGVTVGGNANYQYPTARGEWQVLTYDFTLEAPTEVTFSLGYQASVSTGAANNTLLYVDHLRLLKKDETTEIDEIEGNVHSAPTNDAIYNISGQRVGNNYHGIVIKNGKKTMQ